MTLDSASEDEVKEAITEVIHGEMTLLAFDEFLLGHDPYAGASDPNTYWPLSEFHIRACEIMRGWFDGQNLPPECENDAWALEELTDVVEDWQQFLTAQRVVSQQWQALYGYP